jgi:hypothetical protein
MSSRYKSREPSFDQAWSDYQAAARAHSDAKNLRFKDRGEDESEWRGKTVAFSEPDSQRLRKLDHPALAIAEDAPLQHGRIRPNREGVIKGYDPYDSGRLAKAITARRRDLRRLGEWLKLGKRAKDSSEDR